MRYGAVFFSNLRLYGIFLNFPQYIYNIYIYIIYKMYIYIYHTYIYIYTCIHIYIYIYTYSQKLFLSQLESFSSSFHFLDLFFSWPLHFLQRWQQPNPLQRFFYLVLPFQQASKASKMSIKGWSHVQQTHLRSEIKTFQGRNRRFPRSKINLKAWR